MVKSILKTMNSVNSALPHNVRVLVSFCMLFPLVLGEFLQNAVPDDCTLSVV